MTRLIAVLPLMMLVSCATVVTGPYENIEVRSTPSGANAVLTCADGTKTERLTPVTMKLRRKTANCTMKVTMEGFREETISIVRGINGTFWGNFGFSPLVPVGAYVVAIGGSENKDGGAAVGVAMIGTATAAFLIDKTTGSMYEHEPNQINVQLKPNN